MKKLYSNKLVIFSLVLPGVLVFLFAVLAPICLSVYYGFTDYTGMGEAHLIGWDNYVKLFHDSAFGRSLRNSLLLAIGFICIQHPLAIIAYLWKFIYNPDFGLLNNVLKAFGYQGQINWLSQQNAIWSVLIVLIWHGFGWGMLIYYTGIKNIDPVLYEAASIDGANWSTTFFRITLPLMKPVIQINVTMAIISALKQMETVYLLTNGGPNNSTQFAANYLYQQAFKAFKYGYGNAIGVVFIIICVLVTVVLNRVFKEKQEA